MLIRNKDKAKSKEIRGKVNGTSGKITAEYDEITIMVEIEEEEENLGITPNHNAKTVEILATKPWDAILYMTQIFRNSSLVILHSECQGSIIKINLEIVLIKHIWLHPHKTTTSMDGMGRLVPLLTSQMILLTSTSVQSIVPMWVIEQV